MDFPSKHTATIAVYTDNPKKVEEIIIYAFSRFKKLTRMKAKPGSFKYSGPEGWSIFVWSIWRYYQYEVVYEEKSNGLYHIVFTQRNNEFLSRALVFLILLPIPIIFLGMTWWQLPAILLVVLLNLLLTWLPGFIPKHIIKSKLESSAAAFKVNKRA